MNGRLLRGRVSPAIGWAVIATVLLVIVATAAVVGAMGEAAASLFAGVVLAIVVLRLERS
jgi:hypothetical protein